MFSEQGFRSASPLPKILHPYGVCRSSAISFPFLFIAIGLFLIYSKQLVGLANLCIYVESHV